MPQASGWNDPMVLRAILEGSFSTWMNVGTTSHEELLGDIGYDYGLLGMNDPVPERVVEQTFFLVAGFMDDIKMTEQDKDDLIEKYVAKGQRTVTANKKKSTAMRKEAGEIIEKYGIQWAKTNDDTYISVQSLPVRYAVGYNDLDNTYEVVVLVNPSDLIKEAFGGAITAPSTDHEILTDEYVNSLEEGLATASDMRDIEVEPWALELVSDYEMQHGVKPVLSDDEIIDLVSGNPSRRFAQRTVTANKKKSTAIRKEAIEPAFHEDLMRGSQMLEDFLRLLRKSHDRLIEAGEELENVQEFDQAVNVDISGRLDAAEEATQMLLNRIDQEFDY